jgi:hypothetical protein
MKIYASASREKEINNLDDWFKFCPPEGKEKQWIDLRSAKEMAKFWMAENNIEYFKEFIKQSFNDFDFDYIVPEYVSKFDSFGKPRQHDLLVTGKNNAVILTIEGKSDETFGNMLFGENFKEAITEKTRKNNSKALERMINLYQNYFKSNAKILEIMYQLTHWFAGSLADAMQFNTENFIMILQEFQSNLTKAKNLNSNHIEFEKFIEFISEGKYSKINNKQILGPINNIYTKDNDFSKNLFIGYYSINLD